MDQALVIGLTAIGYWIGLVQKEREVLELPKWDGTISSLIFLPPLGLSSPLLKKYVPFENITSPTVCATQFELPEESAFTLTWKTALWTIFMMAMLLWWAYMLIMDEIICSSGVKQAPRQSTVDEKPLDSFANTLDMLRDDYQDRLKEHIEASETKILTLEQQNNQRTEEIKSQKMKTQIIEYENEDLKQEIALCTAARDDAFEHVDDLKAALDDKHEELQARDKCYTDAVDAEVDAKDLAKDLEKELENARKKTRELEDKIKDRELDWDEADSQIQELEDEIQHLGSNLDKETQKTLELKTKLERARESTKESKKKAEDLESELKQAADSVVDAEKKFKDLGKRLEAAENRAQGLDSELKQAADSAVDAEKKFKDLGTRLEAAEKKAQGLEKEVKELEAAVIECDSTIQGLEDDNRGLESKIEKETLEVIATKEKVRALEAKLKNEETRAIDSEKKVRELELKPEAKEKADSSTGGKKPHMGAAKPDTLPKNFSFGGYEAPKSGQTNGKTPPEDTTGKGSGPAIPNPPPLKFVFGPLAPKTPSEERSPATFSTALPNFPNPFEKKKVDRT